MSIREVNAVAITDAVEELCIRANTQLPPDVKQALDNAHAAEPWPLARQTLELLQQNLCVAAEKTCRSARIPAWPVCSSSLARMCISTAIWTKL